MTLSPLLRKLFLIDLIKGLKVTFDYQAPSEAITEQYPLERPVICRALSRPAAAAYGRGDR